ncbi:hypothetical protein K2173_004201 [Erythroxylum novogranatense]|uniref:Uncharacterized protein n=1 Tax=Erythroxylum novogranatense TaxID=1862640 RepID=A0AAV8SZ51_9ROSI|nr:hypothetical protein K2173_004201 [Erythroxylum novogranatense]
MGDSDEGKQDQRTFSNMEDNDAVTVEFLRARLLYERSVSKSARQRADELAKRVAELEEQLRVVSLQRMKAEKATADVLAILESNGITDVSDMYDSSFDQDTPCESAVGNQSFIEERHSVNSKVRKNESEKVLDFDDGFSPELGRSMSWKAQKDCSSSAEKYKDQSLKRRSSFMSTYSSPKHRTGKSCRQIRRKEPRSFSLEHQTNSIKVGTTENGVSPTKNSSDVGPDILGGFDEIRNDKMSSHAQLSGYWRNEQNSSANDLGYNADKRDEDRDMEKALEHQAELIGRYEEMERTQRDWEEKFREDNNSTPVCLINKTVVEKPDFCDPGNRSDVTEDRYEVKAQTACTAETIPLQNHVAKSKVRELSDVRADGLPPASLGTGFFPERSSISIHDSEIASQDFAFPMARVKQNQPVLGNSHYTGPVHSQNHPDSLGSHDPPTTPIPSFASNPVSSPSKGHTSEIQNDSHALVPHRAPTGVVGVLEALRKARQSLQHKINGFGCDGKHNELSVPLSIPGVKEDSAVGCVGVFRLPTESSVEADGRREFLNPSFRLSLENCFPDARVPAAASNPLLTGLPYLGTRSAISFEDQLCTSKYVEGGSRISAQKSHFDSGLNPSLPSFNKYVYPAFSISPSYPALIPQTTSLQGLSTPLHRTDAGAGPPVDYLSPDNQVRQNMYR